MTAVWLAAHAPLIVWGIVVAAVIVLCLTTRNGSAG